MNKQIPKMVNLLVVVTVLGFFGHAWGETKKAPNDKQSPPGSCKHACLANYDQKIQACAGYKLGNSATACKNPITKEKDDCLKKCK